MQFVVNVIDFSQYEGGIVMRRLRVLRLSILNDVVPQSAELALQIGKNILDAKLRDRSQDVEVRDSVLEEQASKVDQVGQ